MNPAAVSVTGATVATDEEDDMGDAFSKAVQRVNHAREELSLAEAELVGIIRLSQLVESA